MFTRLLKSNKVPFAKLFKITTFILVAYTCIFVLYCFYSYSRTLKELQTKLEANVAWNTTGMHDQLHHRHKVHPHIQSNITTASKMHSIHDRSDMSHGPGLRRRSSVKNNLDHHIQHAISNIDVCSWSHSTPQQYPIAVYKDFSEVDSKYMWFLQLLKSNTNLIFHLNCGTLLGAYRHGGAVPNDADHDLIIPIWMNLPELGYDYASCPQAADMTLDSIHGTQNCKQQENKRQLCGKSKAEWIQIVKEYLLRKFSNEVKVVGVYWWGMEVHRIDGESVHVDLRVNVMEPEPIAAGGVTSWIMNDAGPICRCRYGELEVWCGQNANTTLSALYGSDFMIPDRAIQ